MLTLNPPSNTQNEHGSAVAQPAARDPLSVYVAVGVRVSFVKQSGTWPSPSSQASLVAEGRVRVGIEQKVQKDL